jgi:hypothetical protein
VNVGAAPQSWPWSASALNAASEFLGFPLSSSQLFSFSPHGFVQGGVAARRSRSIPHRAVAPGGTHTRQCVASTRLPLPLLGCFALLVAVFRLQPVVSCNAATLRNSMVCEITHSLRQIHTHSVLGYSQPLLNLTTFSISTGLL